MKQNRKWNNRNKKETNENAKHKSKLHAALSKRTPNNLQRVNKKIEQKCERWTSKWNGRKIIMQIRCFSIVQCSLIWTNHKCRNSNILFEMDGNRTKEMLSKLKWIWQRYKRKTMLKNQPCPQLKKPKPKQKTNIWNPYDHLVVSVFRWMTPSCHCVLPLFVLSYFWW